MNEQQVNESIKQAKQAYMAVSEELKNLERKLSGYAQICGGVAILSGVSMIAGLGTQTPQLGLVGLGLFALIGITAPYYMALCYKKNQLLKRLAELKEKMGIPNEQAQTAKIR